MSVAADELIAYLQQRRQGGDEGKTLLVGYRAACAQFAVAAGLRGEPDHPRFLVFARYLLLQRFDCDGHALLLPARLGALDVYALEWRIATDTGALLVDCDGEPLSVPPAARPLGDLGAPGGRLPGLQRRELDGLYEALRIDPPLTGRMPAA